MKHSVSFFFRRFIRNWPLGVFALLAILLFTRLGFWQLSRAAEKNQMLNASLSMQKRAPILWEGKDTLPKQYQLIQLQGVYTPTVLFLDNQHVEHQFGYQVLSLFRLNSGKNILVDRGFIPVDPARKIWPKIQVSEGLQSISGQVYFPSNKIMALGGMWDGVQGNQSRIEYVDTQQIAEFLHQSIYPFMIRLNKNEPNGFLRDWAIVSMPPERHYAYAVQWFGMASVVLMMLIIFLLKEKNESN